MPSCLKALSHALFACLIFWPLTVCANPFATEIRHAKLTQTASAWMVNAIINYHLSPTAKDALQKGVPLTWNVRVQIRQPGRLWDSVIYRQKHPFSLRFHALLNQYEVKAMGRAEMFLTLNAALSFMSTPQFDLEGLRLQPDQPYVLAVKSQLKREALPVPLRPFAYLNPQWNLSSDWTLWPIQK